MSYTFHYYPDPGIAFDISKMLFVKLNPVKIWSTLLTSIDSQQEDTLFIQHNADLFSPPKAELLLFFFLPTNKQTTFFSTILSQIILSNFSNFSFHSFLTYFENSDRVKKDIHSFYFDSEFLDTTDFEHVIQTSKNIPDKIKLLLFGFYINPDKYINYLTETLHSYYQLLFDSYISCSSPLFIPDEFIDQLLKIKKKQDAIMSPISNISYSVSFATPEFLVFNYAINPPYLITTSRSINRILNTSDLYTVDSFVSLATAFSDKQRMLIINLLIEKKELTLSEISNMLNISKTTVQHHMIYLKKANLVTAVRSYRKATYSLNSKGFNDALIAIQKLANGEALR